jgi:hypothetical protein
VLQVPIEFSFLISSFVDSSDALRLPTRIFVLIVRRLLPI